MAASSSPARLESLRTVAKDSLPFVAESFNAALVEAVKACGGSKQVAPLLWPEKAPEAAQRLLLDCLNDDRAAHLTPDQVLFVLRISRQRGHHIGMQFLADSLGYAEPIPIEPRDEAAELHRQFIEATKSLQAMAARIEQLAPAIRAAA